MSSEFTRTLTACEQALSGGELWRREGKERKGPAAMGSNFEFHVPKLGYMAFFVIFLEIDILVSYLDDGR